MNLAKFYSTCHYKGRIVLHQGDTNIWKKTSISYTKIKVMDTAILYRFWYNRHDWFA